MNSLTKNIAKIIILALIFTAYTFYPSPYTSFPSTAIAASKGAAPVAHWRFDEGGGGTAYDDSANNYDGTLSAGGSGSNTAVGQMWTRQGKVGGAGEFDGTNDYVACGNLGIGDSYTAEAWIKANSLTGTGDHDLYGFTVMASAADGGGYPLWIAARDTEVRVWAYESTPSTGGWRQTTGANLTTGTWFHIAATAVKSGATKVYVNGVEKLSFTNDGDVNWTNIFTIGDLRPSRLIAFDGLIDDVRIYNYARTADQIMVDYNAGMAAYSGTGTDPNEGNPPVLYLPFDENTGIDAYDRSGNGNNGTLTNSPSWTIGKIGSALNFSSTALVSIPDTSSLQLTSSGTAEAWIYPTSYPATGQWSVVVSKGNWSGGINNYSIYYQQSNSSIIFEIGGASANNRVTTAYTNTPLNAWSHLSMTWDGSNLRGYINGVQVGSPTSQTQTPNTSGMTGGIGSLGSSTNVFLGKIDDVKIYNYARTAAQIAYDYNKGKPVAHYKFDEGGGAIAHNAESSANQGAAPVGWWRMDNNWNDASGNGNNGTAGGGATFSSSPKIGPYCGSFDGTDDYVDCGGNTVLNTNTARTVSLWVKTPSNASHRTMIGRSGGNGQWSLNIESNGKLRWHDWINGGTQDLAGNTAIADNNWHYVVATLDTAAGKIKFYVDGKLDAEGTCTQMGTPTGNLYIGSAVRVVGSSWCDASGYIYYFNGLIDDVRIYNYARTAEQIYNDYKTTHGTLVGTNIKFVDGKIGKALQFNGTDDYVNCGTDSNFNITGPITVEAWAKFSDLGARSIVSKWGDDANSNYSWLLFANLWNNGEVNFLVSGNGTSYANCASGAGAIAAGNWYHIAGVYDTSTIKLYINGNLVATKSSGVPSSIKVSSIPLQIGVDSDGSSESRIRYFKGTMDDVRIYNYARTVAQILEDYNAGTALHLGGVTGVSDPWGGVLPVAHWKMDENTGVLARDASGNGYDGILGGDAIGTDLPTWTQGKHGSCLSFDGGDYLNVSKTMSTTNGITVEAWINSSGISSIDSIWLVGSQSSTVGYHWLFFDSGNIRWQYANGTAYKDITKSYTPTVGMWHHVAVTHDYTAKEVIFYINGISLGTSTHVDNVVAVSNKATQIGTYSGGATHTFNGKIDDVRVYNYARTHAQIVWDYNRGKPMAHWRFDEATSGAVSTTTGAIKDDSDNNNDGTASNTTWTYTTGKFGGALSFDGNDYIEITDTTNSSLDCQSQGTLEAWVKSDVAGPGDDTTTYYRGIVTKSSGGGTTTLTYGLDWNGSSSSTGTLRGIISNNTTTESVTKAISFDTTKWYHVAFVWDGTNKKLYVDGVQVNSNGQGINAKNSDEPVRISSAWGTGSDQHWDGLIDDVRIYNYARTAEQITVDYNQGLAAKLGE